MVDVQKNDGPQNQQIEVEYIGYAERESQYDTEHSEPLRSISLSIRNSHHARELT